MLPAAALIYLNFHQLKSIERDKALEAAIHRDFHQMLAIAEKQINLKAYTAAEGIRDLFPSPDIDESEKVQKLDAILSAHSELSHVFLFDADQPLILRSQPLQMRAPEIVHEHAALSKAFGGWFALEGKSILQRMHKRTRPITWFGDRTKRAGSYAYMTTAFFTLPNVAEDRVVIGGACFEPEYLKRTFFPKMLEIHWR